jgi:hypothetical protein
MSRDHQNSTFKELLDRLQQESWQLELLISGFAIFGLFSALDPLTIKFDIAQHDKKIVDTFIWSAALVSCWILIANLLIHVVLRGLWIGALGLRYVSGDIDYEELRYSKKFTKYLQKKIGSFDKYIATLEDYCSVVFAVSFIFIFYFLTSFAFVILLLLITIGFMSNDFEGFWGEAFTWTGIVLLLFTLLGMLLTFIDFITQGFLKRKKWTSFIYLPIYKVFSRLTLSFLYRPLVYNFLDNRFGRRLSWILVPTYIGILYLFSFYYNYSNYLNTDLDSSKNFANYGNYEDLMTKENDFIQVAAIPSKVITDPYLKVFMIFEEKVESRLFSYKPALKPKDDGIGYITDVTFFNNGLPRKERRKRDSLRKVYFETFNEFYNVYIDSKPYNSQFVGTTNKYKKLGFETYLNIDSLSSGKHLLQVTRKKIITKKINGVRKAVDTVNDVLVSIPFWNFKTNKE